MDSLGPQDPPDPEPAGPPPNHNYERPPDSYQPQTFYTEHPPETGRDGPAWEHRDKLGLVPAATATVKEVLLNPGLTFSTARQSGGLGNPLFFAMITNTVFVIISFLSSELMGKSTYTNLIDTMQKSGADAKVIEFLKSLEGPTFMTMLIVALVIMIPLATIFSAFMRAAVVHLCLLIVGGAQRDFESTFRVTAYGMGSTVVFQAIPVVGPVIAGFWNMVVTIIGLKEMHETKPWQAVAAVLMPMLTCLCLLATVGAPLLAGYIGAAKP